MSTAAVSSSSIYQELQAYFQQRGSDLQQLGQALQSGDLATAQQEYSAIQTLGKSGPFANGDPFKMSQREQAFEALGQALQAGDLAAAQQAFTQLKSTFQHSHDSSAAEPPAVVINLNSAPSASSSSTSSTDSASSSASPTGSPTEIVLNLGNVTAGEQITIGLGNASNGSEQLTIGVAQQGQSPEQITLNLNQSANQQIILNLFNSTAGSTSLGSGVNLTA